LAPKAAPAGDGNGAGGCCGPANALAPHFEQVMRFGNSGLADIRPAWPQEADWIRMSMAVFYSDPLGSPRSSLPVRGSTLPALRS